MSRARLAEVVRAERERRHVRLGVAVEIEHLGPALEVAHEPAAAAGADDELGIDGANPLDDRGEVLRPMRGGSALVARMDMDDRSAELPAGRDVIEYLAGR